MLTPRRIRWCFVAAFTTVIPGAFALNSDPLGPSGYVRTTFTIEDGLPDSVVNAVVQSQNGYLWVGTQGGLARFDGQHFTLVRLRGEHSREVSVNALVSTPNGDLWVGTDSGLAHVPKTAVDHFDSKLVKLYHPGAGLGDQIICLLLGREGSLWVGTSRGLYLVDHDNVVTAIPDEWISRIEKAPNGDLLIITSEGYVSHQVRTANSSATNSLGSRFAEWAGSQLIPHPDVSRQLGVKENQIFQVSEFHTGETWFCTPAGVARRVNGSFQRLSPYGVSLKNPAYRVYEDVQGNVWAVTQKGLFRVAGDHLEPFDLTLLARTIYCDPEGDLWIGTGDLGLVRFRRRAIRMYTQADGLPNDNVETILLGHDGTLWVGNACGGLSKFDGQRFTTYSEKDGLSNSCVWSLAEDRHHDIWVGTWGGGLFRFSGGQFTQYSIKEGFPSVVALSVIVAQDGSLWVATKAGLAHMQNGHFRNYSMADGLSSDRIASVFEDRKGVIWAGTSAGIDRLVGDRFEPLRGAADVSDVPYNSLHEDSFGNLYALSLTNGISRIANDRIFNIHRTMEVSGMAEGPGHDLWFSGRQGISRISGESLARAEAESNSPLDYTSFSRDDGLNSRECSLGQPNIAIAPEDKLWIATRTGLGMLSLKQRIQPGHSSPIFVDEVEVGQDRPTPGSRLVLHPGAYHVALHFTAVELASPENVRLQYRLDGVDPDWLDSNGARVAIYTNIPVGTHSFHVRASNGDGIWDRSGISYEITQEPYFYETGWFRALIAVLVLAVAWGLHRLRLMYLTEQFNARLEGRVSERTRVARDFHDTLLQSFQGVLMKFDSIKYIIPDRPTEAVEALDRTIEQARAAMTEGRAAVQALRSSTIVANDLAGAIATFAQGLAADQAGKDCPEFRLYVEGKSRDIPPLVRDEIYKIGCEALRNAFRHAQAKRIEVQIRYDPRRFRLQLVDNGKGIDPEVSTPEGAPVIMGCVGCTNGPKWPERSSRSGVTSLPVPRSS